MLFNNHFVYCGDLYPFVSKFNFKLFWVLSGFELATLLSICWQEASCLFPVT